MLLHWLWELRYCILLIYYKIPTVLHYRGHQKKSGYKHFITRLQCNEHFKVNSINVRNSTSGQIKLLYLYIEKTNRKCLPLTKYTETTPPEMIFSGFKKKMKSATIGAAIPSNKTSIWCGLISIYLITFVHEIIKIT